MIIVTTNISTTTTIIIIVIIIASIHLVLSESDLGSYNLILASHGSMKLDPYIHFSQTESCSSGTSAPQRPSLPEALGHSISLEKVVPLDITTEQEGETKDLPTLNQGVESDLRLLMPY